MFISIIGVFCTYYYGSETWPIKASIAKHHDDLQLTLSLLKTKFDVIGITEHKIMKDTQISNIDIPGYQPFVFDCSDTSHGGTGFYIKNSIVFNKRDDLKFYSPGDFESTFIEIIFPNKKNMIIGCIYRHPSSNHFYPKV